MHIIFDPTGRPQACRTCGGGAFFVGREQTARGQRRVHRCVHCTREAVKARGRDSELRRLYGISAADYDALFKAQCGRCAICGERTKGSRRLAVDHDHLTGKVRGLLCAPCNTALGVVESGFPAKAAVYLGRLKLCSVCGEQKPLDAFPRDRSKPSGRYSLCKVCRSARYAAVPA